MISNKICVKSFNVVLIRKNIIKVNKTLQYIIKKIYGYSSRKNANKWINKLQNN